MVFGWDSGAWKEAALTVAAPLSCVPTALAFLELRHGPSVPCVARTRAQKARAHLGFLFVVACLPALF